MNLYRLFLTSFSLALIIFFSACQEHVKEPSVAGTFYPADEKNLRDTVNGFLDKAQNQPVNGKLIALIAPHAGYQFSGHVAAYTYKHLIDRDIKTVILVGPSHHTPFPGASVYAVGSMKTPLGKVKIHKEMARSLIDEKADVRFLPDVFEKEHSLEVQLPFLQQINKKVKIVPILVGSPTQKSFDHLTTRLIDILKKNKETIIVSSTDFSHYHDYNTAVRKDKKMIDAIERMSAEDVERSMMTGKAEMCGGYPVLFTMAVARGLGATNGILFRYANSGDVSLDKKRVVGYAAMGIYKTELTPKEKKELLSLANNAIKEFISNGVISDTSLSDKRLMVNGATFITINRNGHLRGCTGNIQPHMPLYKSVIRNAVSACSKDPRFPPMNKEELEDMEVEISVLSPLEPLTDVKTIEIGKHGLYLIQGPHSGILLPQVAQEYGWNRNTFLEQVSYKAGLPKDAWKTAQLYSFTADIIK